MNTKFPSPPQGNVLKAFPNHMPQVQGLSNSPQFASNFRGYNPHLQYQQQGPKNSLKQDNLNSFDIPSPPPLHDHQPVYSPQLKSNNLEPQPGHFPVYPPSSPTPSYNPPNYGNEKPYGPSFNTLTNQFQNYGGNSQFQDQYPYRGTIPLPSWNPSTYSGTTGFTSMGLSPGITSLNNLPEYIRTAVAFTAMNQLSQTAFNVAKTGSESLASAGSSIMSAIGDKAASAAETVLKTTGSALTTVGSSAISGTGSALTTVGSALTTVGGSAVSGAGSALALVGNAASGTGSALVTAAGASWSSIAKAALTIGPPLVSIVPYAGALAGLGYLGYKAYKWHKERNQLVNPKESWNEIMKSPIKQQHPHNSHSNPEYIFRAKPNSNSQYDFHTRSPIVNQRPPPPPHYPPQENYQRAPNSFYSRQF